MVEDARRKLRALVSCPFIKGVVNDETILTAVRGERAQMLVHDALREHCRESEPVGVHILEKAVVGVLRELLVKIPNPLLYVETTHAEDIAENISE